ncbi:hypothetical protein ACLB1R_15795 [Escherichia coli]
MALSFNDQATEIINMLQTTGLIIEQGVSVQVIPIHFQNRLSCAYLRALFQPDV